MKLRNTSYDCESQRLAQRVAKLEKKLFTAMERIAQLEEENIQLCEENARILPGLRRQSALLAKG